MLDPRSMKPMNLTICNPVHLTNQIYKFLNFKTVGRIRRVLPREVAAPLGQIKFLTREQIKSDRIDGELLI